MSQLSQGSAASLELSQETLNHIFTTVDGIFPNQQDLHRVQSEYYSCAPLSVQLSEGNLHENVEMTLDCIGLMKPENHSDGGLTYSVESFYVARSLANVDTQPFSQDQSFRTEVKQEPVDNFFQATSALTTPPPEQPLPQPFIVSNTDFPGIYGFDLGFEEEKAPPTKSAQWTYSLFLKKLFVKMRCIVPIRLKLTCFPPAGFFVRVVVIYRHPEHYKEIVERCPNHITKHKDGHHAPKHLIRCENPSTEYETCPVTGRHTFKIPLTTPQAGADFVQEMFQFMCFSSCPGGLNRRPILVIFTLECGYRVLGRKALNVRICACPGRDRTTEETNETKKRTANNTIIQNNVGCPTPPVLTSTPNVTPPPLPTPQVSTAPSTPPEETSTSAGAEEMSETHLPKVAKKRSHSYITSGVEVRALSFEKNKLKKARRQEDEEIFTIQVKGRENYEMLLKIKEGLDLMKMVPQAMVDSYRARCPPCGKWTNSQSSQTPDSQNSNSQPDELEQSVSQLSRSDSGSSYQSPTSSQQSTGEGGGRGTEVSAVRFTLRRTVSLEKKGA